MVIEFAPEKLPHYASTLFGIHVETRGRNRYVSIEGGGELECEGMQMLKLCRQDQILSTFGSKVFDAICASPIYQEDARQFRSRTRSVSLGFSRWAKDSGFLTVYMGVYRTTELIQSLYPRLE
jgi:hypothetical protein